MILRRDDFEKRWFLEGKGERERKRERDGKGWEVGGGFGGILYTRLSVVQLRFLE